MLKEIQKLPEHDATLLLLKQRKLQEEHAQVSMFIKASKASTKAKDKQLAQAAAATLVFTQEAAGTAVCISPSGFILTCSHCIAESKKDYRPNKNIWLLLASGDPVQAKPVAWDPHRDLALLQITAAPSSLETFPCMRMLSSAPKPYTKMLCIGHPGSEDFEADTSGVATDYDVLHISEGRHRGLAADQDVQDNSEIGALMHDCWTYWGHSGAPLIEKSSGLLTGLHSSWDDETSMRRGIAWEAIRAFLDEHDVHA